MKIVLVVLACPLRKEYYRTSDNGIKTGDKVVVIFDGYFELGEITYINENYKGEVEALEYIERIATPYDFDNFAKKNKNKDDLAKDIQDICNSLNLNMIISDINITLDGKKIFVIYKSENRVDFRELLRTLSDKYRTKLEMVQMNKIQLFQNLGDIGTCGQITCCSRLKCDIPKLNIKEVVNQKIPPSSTFATGKCDKYKCCLQFENQYYNETRDKLPKIGSMLSFGGEDFLVMEQDIFKLTVKLKNMGDNSISIKDFSNEV